jgi:hypothetical protein
MKYKSFLLLTVLSYTACKQVDHSEKPLSASPVQGTWKLVSNVIITKGDTVVAYPVKGKEQEMIKMYNESHFSFFSHDTKHGKVASPVYSSGAGTYILSGDDYKEHLEYCNYREWENHDFSFKLTVRNDTLLQRGTEKIDSLNVNREIIETYVRVPGKKH